MVSPELTPFAKVGGLADMVASLSMELANAGHDIRIVIPKHGGIDTSGENWIRHPEPMIVNLGLGHIEFTQVWESSFLHTPAKLYLLEYNKYFARHEIYTGPWGSHGDNNERFAFFSRAALDLCYYLNWIPDVIHCHDWTTGFIPLYLNTTEWHKPLGNAATVFTIHNLLHQGIFSKETIRFAGLPNDTFRQECLECLGSINMMKGALYNATKLTTVSPNYAQEIQQPAYGCGLDPVIKLRAHDLIGVINGIDIRAWNPETDPFLPSHFSAKDLSGKATCKEALQKEFHLEVNPAIPIMSAVSRLYDQKGLDLLLEIIPWIMNEMHVQIIVLGTGEKTLADGFNHMAHSYPGQVGVYIGHQEAIAHRIEAGSDFFIMPSRFEPCGLNQLYSMRYGTLPIARSTGGLFDTISQYQEGQALGTGFLFEQASAESLYYTIGWACSTYYDRKNEYLQLQQNAMKCDFSWSKSAKKYESIYQWSIQARSHRK